MTSVAGRGDFERLVGKGFWDRLRGVPAGGKGGGLRNEDEGLLLCLGAATVLAWSHLPRDEQQKIFEEAARLAEAPDPGALREKLALFLHGQHERTAG